METMNGEIDDRGITLSRSNLYLTAPNIMNVERKLMRGITCKGSNPHLTALQLPWV